MKANRLLALRRYLESTPSHEYLIIRILLRLLGRIRLRRDFVPPEASLNIPELTIRMWEFEYVLCPSYSQQY